MGRKRLRAGGLVLAGRGGGSVSPNVFAEIFDEDGEHLKGFDLVRHEVKLLERRLFL